MKTNYHTHTRRCGHSSNANDEEYILKAIEAGFNELGFSEHAMFSDIYNEYGMRPPYNVLEEYISTLDVLKVKYKNQIKIFKAMECEYFQEYYDELKELLDSKKLDYLIFGNHFLFHENGHIYCPKEVWGQDNYFDLYVEKAIEAIESNLFTIFAHPDFGLRSYKWNDHIEQLCLKMLEKAKEHNVYVEINLGGMRRGKRMINDELRYEYPYEPFWKLVAKVGNKVVIGVDAHDPNDFFHETYNEALKFAKSLTIQVEEKVLFK